MYPDWIHSSYTQSLKSISADLAEFYNTKIHGFIILITFLSLINSFDTSRCYYDYRAKLKFKNWRSLINGYQRNVQ